MTSNRVGGASPSDPGKGPDPRTQEHRKVEKVEKVKAISETENEHTRKKFQRFMEEDEEKVDARSPSPFESGFYTTEEGGKQSPSPLEDLENNGVPRSSYSSPPDVRVAPEPEKKDPPLPTSHSFWANNDNSHEHQVKGPKYQEKKKEPPAKRGKNIAIPGKVEKESLYGTPGKKETKHPTGKEMIAAPVTTAVQTTRMPLKEKEPTTPNKEKEKKEGVLSPLLNEKDVHSSKERGAKDEQGGHGGKQGQPIVIDAPSQSLLPSHVVPMAETAALQATTYLSPQTAPLFFQIVGTIYVMTTTAGVSKTEILLNAPSFANSKFFGATISIEKYATAPDSLNIRLTGTNEAVKTFNQNIPNLYAAFQNGNFGFRIGRITAEYSVERPIFRRKEEKDMGEGGDFSDQRGKG